MRAEESDVCECDKQDRCHGDSLPIQCSCFQGISALEASQMKLSLGWQREGA